MLCRLFCYGTLRRPAVIGALLGRVPDAATAWLPDHRLSRIADRPWLGVAASAGDCAEGTLYDVLNAGELRRLDRYEGTDYRRAILPVETDVGRRRAWIYLPRRPVSGDTEPPALPAHAPTQWRLLGLPPARRPHRASKTRPG